LRPRFQFDNDVKGQIVRGFARIGLEADCRNAQEAALDGLDDQAVLVMAADENRILITHDLRTMPRHFAAFVAKRRSPGVLAIPQYLPVSRAIDSLCLVWETSDHRDWENRMCLIPFGGHPKPANEGHLKTGQ
jgi:hypothetical protein